jgi:Mn2+/Fe2+ NRAMP family transporter
VRRRHRRPDVYDIVTPTERERRDDQIARRKKRYLAVMIPCVVLVVFGFFVPAPTPLRVIALVIASVLPPIAAIVGNESP